MKKLKVIFLNLPLTGKMLITYVIAVLIPTLALATGLYLVNVNAIQQAYYQNQRYEIATAKESLTTQINRITAASNLFQESNALLEILDGAHPDVSSTIFYYLRDVQPLLNVANSNPYIQNIRIYGFGDMLLNMRFGITSLHYLDIGEEFAEAVDGTVGVWMITWQEDEPSLKFYRTIYASSYPFRRGLLELTVDFRTLIQSALTDIEAESLFFTTVHDDVIRYEEGLFRQYEYVDIDYSRDSMIFDMEFRDRFPTMLVSIRAMENPLAQNFFILFIIIILFIVFTVLYFLLTKSIISRLQAFKSHIQKTNIEDLKPFESISKDEIGVVISSYNDLVARTNTLIHENLMAQLRKKEAEYYALQSQIKPHFLYNILENIRMSAETNADLDTADMLTTLGKYMRYSLNMGSHPIRLEDELYFAKDYLKIHKIRMKEKIHYEIDVSTEIDDIYVPRFLLQPLLENSVKHGFRLGEQLCIQVCVTEGDKLQRPGYVLLTLQDNGNGIKNELLHQLQERLKRRESEPVNHIGLLNVNSRISAFYHTEEEHFFLESEEKKGTKITIILKRGYKSHENTDS